MAFRSVNGSAYRMLQFQIPSFIAAFRTNDFEAQRDSINTVYNTVHLHSYRVHLLLLQHIVARTIHRRAYPETPRIPWNRLACPHARSVETNPFTVVDLSMATSSGLLRIFRFALFWFLAHARCTQTLCTLPLQPCFVTTLSPFASLNVSFKPIKRVPYANEF